MGFLVKARWKLSSCCSIPVSRVCVQLLQKPLVEITQGVLSEVPLVKSSQVLHRFQFSLFSEGFTGWFALGVCFSFCSILDLWELSASASVTLWRWLSAAGWLGPSPGCCWRLPGVPSPVPAPRSIDAPLAGEQGTRVGALLRCCWK